MLDVKNISPNFLAMVYMYLFEVEWCWDYKLSLLFSAELQRRNEHEKNQLTEKFQAAENVLKVNA